MSKKVDKKVDFNHSMITPTQADILQGFNNNLTIIQIAEHRKVTRQAIDKGKKILLRKGMIEKVGLLWRLTDKGRKGLHSFMGLTNKIREHNIGIKIDIRDSPRNWDKKRNQLVKMPYFNKRVQLKNNNYDLLSFGNLWVKTTTKSIIIKLPTIFDSTPEGAMIQAMEIFDSKIPSIENAFKIKLIKDYRCNITFISQEYARLNDALAKIYKKEGNKLYVTDENGELRFIADYSFAVNEFETVHTIKAGDDMSAVNPFLLDLAENPTTFSEVKEVVAGCVKSQLVFDHHMKEFAVALNKHIPAYEGMKDEVADLKNVIKLLANKIDQMNKK